MELLVAYRDDPAGYNMAKFLAQDMTLNNGIYRGDNYDLVIISTPAISADWLEEKYNYDGFVFLSKHAAESGVLALTCHCTGNFADAKFGGNNRQVAIPHPALQKTYLQILYKNRDKFPEFEITIEATHHGPTALSKPSIFIEIGTTEKQWSNIQLCNDIAGLVHQAMISNNTFPIAICFGGTHYPKKFTSEILNGKYSLGTVMPRYMLDNLDEDLFSHIMTQNRTATAALLDWRGLGHNKQKLMNLLEETDLEVIKL